MNIAQHKDGALYPEAAGHFESPSQAGPVFTAYMVLARMPGGKVIVVEGQASALLGAIDHLNRQCKLLRDWMDIAFHSGFWVIMTAEEKRREQAFREAMGLTAITDALTPPKGEAS